MPITFYLYHFAFSIHNLLRRIVGPERNKITKLMQIFSFSFFFLGGREGGKQKVYVCTTNSNPFKHQQQTFFLIVADKKNNEWWKIKIESTRYWKSLEDSDKAKKIQSPLHRSLKQDDIPRKHVYTLTFLHQSLNQQQFGHYL